MRLLLPTAGNRSIILDIWRKTSNVEKVITTEIDPLAPGILCADKCYQVSRSDSAEFADEVNAICRMESIDLIVPMADLDLIFFSRERERFLGSGTDILVAGKKAIDISVDKLKTFEFFESLGIPTPSTILLRDGLENIGSIHYPQYLKPRYVSMKNSSRYLFALIENSYDLEYYGRKLNAEHDSYLLQEYLGFGKEINVDFFVQDTELKRIVTLYRLKAGQGGGITRGQTIPCHPRIMGFVENILDYMGFFGPANIQVYDLGNGSFKVTEINPRFSNSAALCVHAAGVDYFDLTVRMLNGERIVPEFDNYKMIYATTGLHRLVVEKPEFEGGRNDKDA
ncbi:MAG: ATP-grasp domain-containing protein [Deltaproteobacteria bacterium]|nr:ATP-grasp domain-containing protein [Deltaproteobacteria bacterium]